MLETSAAYAKNSPVLRSSQKHKVRRRFVKNSARLGFTSQKQMCWACLAQLKTEGIYDWCPSALPSAAGVQHEIRAPKQSFPQSLPAPQVSSVWVRADQLRGVLHDKLICIQVYSWLSAWRFLFRSEKCRGGVCLRDLVGRSLAKLSWLRWNRGFWFFQVTENTAIEVFLHLAVKLSIVAVCSPIECRCAGAGGKQWNCTNLSQQQRQVI